LPSLRHFADVSKTDTNRLCLTLVAPHQTFIKDRVVKQVNLSTEDGDVGILAGHLPMVLQLRPGVIEVFNDDEQKGTERFFESGGFATINPDSSLQIAVMEAVTLDQIDHKLVESGLTEAEALAAKAKSDEEKVEAAIQLQVYKAMSVALGK
jgi:F-type H+-transporting ATPase subunit delta